MRISNWAVLAASALLTSCSYQQAKGIVANVGTISIGVGYEQYRIDTAFSFHPRDSRYGAYAPQYPNASTQRSHSAGHYTPKR